MKTRYYAEAQGALLKGDFSNDYLVDLYSGSLYIGALSSMPDSGGDGWQGAREVFSSDIEEEESLFPFGVTDPALYQGAYTPINVAKSQFTDPTLVRYEDQAVSGVALELQSQVTFNIATLAWGSVVGCVLYTTRAVGITLRITPLATIEFIAPKVVTVNDRLIIPNSDGSRIRLIELMQRQILE